VDPFDTPAASGGIVDPFDSGSKTQQPTVEADHGLARRQKMSAAERLLQPITEYPAAYQEMRREAQEQFGRGLGQLAEGWRTGTGVEPGSLAGLGTFAKGAANVGLARLAMSARRSAPPIALPSANPLRTSPASRANTPNLPPNWRHRASDFPAR
jgi:hypothetical protein